MIGKRNKYLEGKLLIESNDELDEYLEEAKENFEKGLEELRKSYSYMSDVLDVFRGIKSIIKSDQMLWEGLSEFRRLKIELGDIADRLIEVYKKMFDEEFRWK